MNDMGNLYYGIYFIFPDSIKYYVKPMRLVGWTPDVLLSQQTSFPCSLTYQIYNLNLELKNKLCMWSNMTTS